ncbi:hypothetical protein F8388_022350 [Cannabis sativa]|uniref:Pentatricopeptide repeat-containing protein n=1 Tax=Cannabis sativa TaxID=3483 RepID=A0A7J6G8V4_CANSA|nr:hypothetical protein F8388_022350 [Cannabis sativa]
MENKIFVGRKFGTEEFNALLRAFCTQRQMKEARPVFLKMPLTKRVNMLLLGFKESRDTTAVELFYHEMIARGFKQNVVTYNIKIDVYYKTGCFGDGLRLLEEMERSNLSPMLGTITTFIHGAGIAPNPIMARKLCKDAQAATTLMVEQNNQHQIPVSRSNPIVNPHGNKILFLDPRQSRDLPMKIFGLPTTSVMQTIQGWFLLQLSQTAIFSHGKETSRSP